MMERFCLYRGPKLVLFAALTLFSCASAGDVVGRIDFVDTRHDRLGIDNRVYTFSSESLAGKAPGGIGKLRPEHLEPGQIVEYANDHQRIIELRVLHGTRDIPR